MQTGARVVVQRIDTRWTKATRDAAGRELRARLPSAYALPETLVHTSLVCARHFIERHEPSFDVREWCESDDNLTTGRGGAAMTMASVRLAIVKDELEVTFLCTDAGEPRRHRRKTSIRAGSWIRVLYNGRFRSWGSRGLTIYEDKIVNVAFRADRRATMFSGVPPFELDMQADLF
jgi:hypothetical protein